MSLEFCFTNSIDVRIILSCIVVSIGSTKHGAIAQLVEHLHGMQGVSGSSPLGST